MHTGLDSREMQYYQEVLRPVSPRMMTGGTGCECLVSVETDCKDLLSRL